MEAKIIARSTAMTLARNVVFRTCQLTKLSNGLYTFKVDCVAPAHTFCTVKNGYIGHYVYRTAYISDSQLTLPYFVLQPTVMTNHCHITKAKTQGFNIMVYGAL